MGDKITIELKGVQELKDALADATSKIRKKAVRGALREAGKVIQSAARADAPILKTPSKYRKVGTVKKNITVRPSKFARQGGDEGVYINVRPLSGKRQTKLGKKGAQNPNDPYYWLFLEFGTKYMAARSFLRPAATRMGNAAVQKFMDSVVPQIEKLNEKARKK